MKNVPPCKRWTDEGNKNDLTDMRFLERLFKTEVLSIAKKLNRKFLLSENTEGVSDAIGESGVSHGVGESHASGLSDTANLASVGGTLEKITDGGSSCDHYKAKKWLKASRQLNCHCEVCGTLVTRK